MLRKTIFGVESGDGFKIRQHGRNSVRVARGEEEMFVFVEPLATTPVSYQLDTSAVWLDDTFSKAVTNPAVTKSIIAMVVDYFELLGVNVEIA